MRLALGIAVAVLRLAVNAQELAITPAAPSPLDTVRVEYRHIGCTNPDSIKLAQDTNRITVQVDRVFSVDCGTVQGFAETFTLGRFPSGAYSVQLIVNPPPGTLGPSILLGPITFTVAPLPPTGASVPHENYTDMWWNAQESGWALNLYQSGDTLIGVWSVYEADGRPTWYALLSGYWMRGADGVLHYEGTVYRTSGPSWTGPFDPARVTVQPTGTAEFTPTSPLRAQFNFNIGGVTGSKTIERFRF